MSASFVHSPGTNVAALSTPFQGLLGTWTAKWPVACLQATGLRCAPVTLFQKIPRPWMVCERSSVWAAFGGDKICLLSSRLLPAAKGSYRAANLRHCSKSGSRSVQLLGQFPELPLLSSRSRNVAIFGHLVCYVEFVLEVCHSDRLHLILCGLHRLLQRYVHHADEVSRQIRPSSPAGAVLLFEPVGHQGLWLHQPERADLISTILRSVVNS